MPLPTPPRTLLQDASLFLDFDGTLVPIANRPDEIVVEPDLLSLLERLHGRLEGRLTLISGRGSADVLRWLAPLRIPVVGSHGLERDGVAAPRSTLLDEELRQLRAVEEAHQGVLLEEKPLGAALHFREAPDAEDACKAATARVAASAGMQVQAGKMVFEIKPPGGDKGSAIRALMDEPLHKGHRPIFLGDDLTDEHGFAAVGELGGAGVLVGAERATAATYRLPGVPDVRRWLAQACEVLS